MGFETACWTESRWFLELQGQSADLESIFVKIFKPLNVYFPVFWKTWSTRTTRRSWRLIRRWRTSWLIVMHINDFHGIWFQVERPQLVRWKYVLFEKITILYNSSEILTSKQRSDFSWKWTQTSCLQLFRCMRWVYRFLILSIRKCLLVLAIQGFMFIYP